MLKKFLACSWCLSVLVIAGCSSTKFTSTEKAVGAGPFDLAGKKVAALVMHSDEATRTEGENALAAELTKRGMIGVAAHSFLPVTSDLKSADVKTAIKASGAEGLVILRLIRVDQTTRYVPSFSDSYYDSMMTYYDVSWTLAYEPGYYQTLNTYVVETACYQVADEKRVWVGTSETFSPGKVTSLVRELVKEAGKIMRKQGLLVIKK